MVFVLRGLAIARARRRSLAHLGQGLVELAIVLPVLLLLLGGAIDFGRVFFAGVAIENAAKEGAFFGATAPRCDTSKTGCLDPSNVEWHVRNEAPGLAVSFTAECFHLGSSVSVASCAEDDTYRVTVGHTFTMVTPILSQLLGTTIDISSTADARVFNPAFTPGSPLPTPTGTSSASATPTPGTCVVPNFIGMKANSASGVWTGAGFTGTLTEDGNGNFTINSQTLTPNSSQVCTANITVSSSAPTPTPLPTPTPSGSPTPTPTPTPTPSATPTPTPTPVPQCTVPNFNGVRKNSATGVWTAAGFAAANISFLPGSGNYTIRTQSVAAGTVGPCATQAIQVGP